MEKEDKKESYLVFKYCPKKCLDCASCGYVWGPGHPEENKRGKNPYWILNKPPLKEGEYNTYQPPPQETID